jgi:hypothetical protein
MATMTRSRKPVKPVHGSCRWLTKPNAHHEGGVLQINGTDYEVFPLFDDQIRVGYRLVKADGTMYDVGTAEPHGRTCDCPDATYQPERPGGCKHVKALRAALAALAK